VSAINAIGLTVSAALVIFVIAALLFPERF
jgi:K+-transporting ATPase KdpF subunit